jgi:hypothetical protein
MGVIMGHGVGGSKFDYIENPKIRMASGYHYAIGCTKIGMGLVPDFELEVIRRLGCTPIFSIMDTVHGAGFSNIAIVTNPFELFSKNLYFDAISDMPISGQPSLTRGNQTCGGQTSPARANGGRMRGRPRQQVCPTESYLNSSGANSRRQRRQVKNS